MKGEPLIALHGNLGRVDDWAGLGWENVRAVDLWAHAHRSFDEFADVLAERITAPGERPWLVGYSLGGRLALHALASHPDRWSGAVVVSAHPGLRSETEREARRAADEAWARRAETLPWAEFLREWDAQAVLADSAPPAGREELASRREAVADAFRNWSLGRQADLRPALGRFERPVLWLTGEGDAKFRRLGEEMAERMPRCRHGVAEGWGHRVPAAAIAEAVRAWPEGPDGAFRAQG